MWRPEEDAKWLPLLFSPYSFEAGSLPYVFLASLKVNEPQQILLTLSFSELEL